MECLCIVRFMDSSSPVVLAKLWNDNNQLIIASIEYLTFKQLNTSPNLRNTNPYRGKSE